MSAIGKDDIARLAQLARLEISSQETPAAVQAMNDILAMMAQLQNADVGGEDDMAHAQFLGNTLRLRDDDGREGYSRETLMAGAPETADGCLIVPKVIE